MVLITSMELPEYLTTRFRDQAAAAEAFKVSQGTISHWTTGRRRPKPDKAREIVEHSNGEVSYDEIFRSRVPSNGAATV